MQKHKFKLSRIMQKNMFLQLLPRGQQKHLTNVRVIALHPLHGGDRQQDGGCGKPRTHLRTLGAGLLPTPHRARARGRNRNLRSEDCGVAR